LWRTPAAAGNSRRMCLGARTGPRGRGKGIPLAERPARVSGGRCGAASPPRAPEASAASWQRRRQADGLGGEDGSDEAPAAGPRLLPGDGTWDAAATEGAAAGNGSAAGGGSSSAAEGDAEAPASPSPTAESDGKHDTLAEGPLRHSPRESRGSPARPSLGATDEPQTAGEAPQASDRSEPELAPSPAPSGDSDRGRGSPEQPPRGGSSSPGALREEPRRPPAEPEASQPPSGSTLVSALKELGSGASASASESDCKARRKIKAQVCAFVQSVLDPFYRARTMDKAQYKTICNKCVNKVMSAHPRAKDSRFLIAESDRIQKLVKAYLLR